MNIHIYSIFYINKFYSKLKFKEKIKVKNKLKGSDISQKLQDRIIWTKIDFICGIWFNKIIKQNKYFTKGELCFF